MGLPYLITNLSQVLSIDNNATEGKTNINNTIVMKAKPKPLLLFSSSIFALIEFVQIGCSFIESDVKIFIG